MYCVTTVIDLSFSASKKIFQLRHNGFCLILCEMKINLQLIRVSTLSRRLL